jgi:PIN domain nuclease of toxin-antitoxin system
VTLLLDTQALLLWLDGGKGLSSKVRVLISDRKNALFVSAASGFEVTTKFRLGKLPAAQPLVADFPGWIDRAGFQHLPLSLAHAARAGLFAAEHRDPFDRLLAAQSLIEGMPLVSGDTAIDRFGIQRIW